MKKAFVFDFDDTLAKTDAKILIRRRSDSAIVDSLTPAEYNQFADVNHMEYFDYSQFSDELYIKNGKATWLMPLAQEVHAENHDVYILTARGSAAAESIDCFLRSFDINAKQVCCVGDSKGDIAKNKQTVLLTILQGYDKVYFYDDHAENVKAAKEIGCKSYKV